MFTLIRVLGLLDGSESSAGHLVASILSSFIDCIGSTWGYAHWLASCLDVSFTYILLLNRFLNSLMHVVAIVA